MNKMPDASHDPSGMIDWKIDSLPDWRGALLGELRTLIHAALPKVEETWKWDVPVWELDGILCTGEVYKAKVKLTFPKGASLEDPAGLFNSSLEGNARRAIDFAEGEVVDAKAFKALMKTAAAFNTANKKAKKA